MATETETKPADVETAKADAFSWAEFTEVAEEVTEGSAVTLSDIPEDIKKAVERSFSAEKGLRFKFPSKKIADDFLNLARKYGELRAEGRLTIRTTKLDDPASVQFRAKKFEARTAS